MLQGHIFESFTLIQSYNFFNIISQSGAWEDGQWWWWGPEGLVVLWCPGTKFQRSAGVWEQPGSGRECRDCENCSEGSWPFDGILGFSQGAALVAMLCALQEQKLEAAFNFRFAILVAGFRSACSQHQHFYEGPAITIPLCMCLDRMTV